MIIASREWRINQHATSCIDRGISLLMALSCRRLEPAASEPGPGARRHTPRRHQRQWRSNPRREFTARRFRSTRRRSRIDDGDSVFIRWPGGDDETVRILGIDSPEVRHDEHGIPLDQSFGPEARAFAQGAFAAATDVKLIRAGSSILTAGRWDT